MDIQTTTALVDEFHTHPFHPGHGTATGRRVKQILFYVLEVGQAVPPSRQTVVPRAPGSVFCAGLMHPRGSGLDVWRVLRAVYCFSWAVVRPRRMLVFCHFGNARWKVFIRAHEIVETGAQVWKRHKLEPRQEQAGADEGCRSRRRLLSRCFQPVSASRRDAPRERRLERP